jgi:hypothetical protein
VVGLDAARTFLLYTCSSIFICRHEAKFIERWLAALRGSSHPALAGVGVLVRPHPGSPKFADQLQLVLDKYPEQVAIYPRSGGYPVTADGQDDYFDSLHHAAAVVGINTSAMLEAGILGRRCLTVCDPEVAESQAGMLHFSHLLRSGFLWTSTDFESHFAQLNDILEGRDDPESLRTFVGDFLRPHGIDRAATPLLAAGIERLGALNVEPLPAMPLNGVLRAALVPIALYFRSVEGLRTRKRWIDKTLYQHRREQIVLLLARANKYLLRKPARSLRGSIHRANKRAGKLARRAARAARSRLGRMVPRSLVRGRIAGVSDHHSGGTDASPSTRNAYDSGPVRLN